MAFHLKMLLRSRLLLAIWVLTGLVFIVINLGKAVKIGEQKKMPVDAASYPDTLRRFTSGDTLNVRKF